jgi:hypothetical protein
MRSRNNYSQVDGPHTLSRQLDRRWVVGDGRQVLAITTNMIDQLSPATAWAYHSNDAKEPASGMSVSNTETLADGKYPIIAPWLLPSNVFSLHSGIAKRGVHQPNGHDRKRYLRSFYLVYNSSSCF